MILLTNSEKSFKNKIHFTNIQNVSNCYSNALYTYCVENHCLNVITEDFQKLVYDLNITSYLSNYLANFFFTKKFKIYVLKILLKPSFNKKTINFLNFLIHCNKINILIEIVHKFLEKIYDLLNFKIIKVDTSFYPTLKQNNRIISFFKRTILSHKVVLLITINPFIIDGLIFENNSEVYNFSVIEQLNLVKFHFSM